MTIFMDKQKRDKLRRCQSIAVAAAIITAILVNTPAATAAVGEPAYAGAFSGAPIPAEIIFRQSADAVFLLETFDSKGESIRTGSGFFISEDGLAATNLHVLDEAASATITLYNGEVYPVRGVNAKSEEHNLAIISIDSDAGGWDYLPLGNSDRVEVGNSVYTIGSPLGLINTMTAGIVSNTKRDVDGNILIQFTAPISFGSGGTALLDTLGRVVGVASSSFSYGQNLNLAVPVNHLKAMKAGECVPLGKP